MRLFIGIALPDDVRARLARLQSGLPGARWVEPANLHLTLRFIGEVPGDQADALHHTLAEIRAPVFELAVSGVGSFGSGRKTRAVWAGVEPSAALAHVQAKVESAVARAGCEADGRKFKPHVTLARLKGTAWERVRDYLEVHGGFKTQPLTVSAFSLFRSHLGHAGVHYETLFDYPLADPPVTET